MKWILVVAWIWSHPTVGIEFDSKVNCEQAKSVIVGEAEADRRARIAKHQAITRDMDPDPFGQGPIRAYCFQK